MRATGPAPPTSYIAKVLLSLAFTFYIFSNMKPFKVLLLLFLFGVFCRERDALFLLCIYTCIRVGVLLLVSPPSSHFPDPPTRLTLDTHRRWMTEEEEQRGKKWNDDDDDDVYPSLPFHSTCQRALDCEDLPTTSEWAAVVSEFCAGAAPCYNDANECARTWSI
jgi:hypothetical protein